MQRQDGKQPYDGGAVGTMAAGHAVATRGVGERDEFISGVQRKRTHWSMNWDCRRRESPMRHRINRLTRVERERHTLSLLLT